MQDVTAEDESSNTSYTGRAIHTPTTLGLITRTYMPPKHCQTFTFLTPLRLDDQQYKETFETLEQILIPTSLWPLIPTTTALHSAASFKASATTRSTSTSAINFNAATSVLSKKSLPARHSPCPPILPSLFPLAPHPQSTVLATHPTSLPLHLPKAQPTRRWLSPTNK